MSITHKCNELNEYLQNNKGEIIEIERHDDEWQLFIDYDSDYRDCTSKTIVITYCPFCGEKLLIVSNTKEPKEFQTGGFISKEEFESINTKHNFNEGFIITYEQAEEVKKALEIIKKLYIGV